MTYLAVGATPTKQTKLFIEKLKLKTLITISQCAAHCNFLTLSTLYYFYILYFVSALG